MKKNCFKEFAHYVVLNILGMLGLSCYILADTFFVSKSLGSNGLAALNLAIPVYSFIHGTGLMLGMGGATRYSILKGQGEEERGSVVFTHTIAVGIGFAALFLVLGCFFSGQIAELLGADEAIFAMCRTYLQVLLLFSPAFLLNEILLCFVRNDEAPRLAMAAMLGGSFSNILLDYVFLFPCKMGIFGAVFATGLAPMVSLAILSPFFWKKKNHFHLVRCTPVTRIVGYIFAGGIPSLIGELSSGIVIIIFNIIILEMEGNLGVAAYGVIANLSLVVVSIYNGIGQGIQPLISEYFGRGEKEKIRLIAHYAVWTAVLISVLLYGGLFLGADSVAAIFNSEKNPALQTMAVQGIKLYFTACLFAGCNIIQSLYFTATDQPGPANLLSSLRGFILIIPLAFLMAKIGGMTGLWLTFPATELLTFLVGHYYNKCDKKYELGGQFYGRKNENSSYDRNWSDRI